MGRRDSAGLEAPISPPSSGKRPRTGSPAAAERSRQVWETDMWMMSKGEDPFGEDVAALEMTMKKEEEEAEYLRMLKMDLEEERLTVLREMAELDGPLEAAAAKRNELAGQVAEMTERLTQPMPLEDKLDLIMEREKVDLMKREAQDMVSDLQFRRDEMLMIEMGALKTRWNQAVERLFVLKISMKLLKRTQAKHREETIDDVRTSAATSEYDFLDADDKVEWTNLLIKTQAADWAVKMDRSGCNFDKIDRNL